MRGIKILLLFALATSIMIVGTGCIKITTKKSSAADGGLYKSFDKAESWLPRTAVLTAAGDSPTISDVGVYTMAMDPQDSGAIYLGSGSQGLFYTYDGGESWMRDRTLNAGKIDAIAVDPKNKCTIYAAMGRTIYKTVDCNRSWDDPYVDTRMDQVVNTLVVDFFNSSIIYAGTSKGEFMRSVDGGQSWAVIKRFENYQVKKVLMDHKDSRVLYVAVDQRGLFKTVDAGENWIDLRAPLEPYSGSFTFYDLLQDKTSDNTLYWVSKFGILRTADGGEAWEKVELLTPEEGARIYSIALNPQDAGEIYYATRNTIYKTSDGGKSWTPKLMPSTRTATCLMVDPSNPMIIYMGLTRFDEKKGTLIY